jgi:hypothetical protein
MWYDMTPADYAKGLRYSARRADDDAEKYEARPESWAKFDAAYNRAQARRLRAMAMLCDMSDATRAGDVDFRKLNDSPPTLTAQIDAILHKIEEDYAAFTAAKGGTCPQN